MEASRARMIVSVAFLMGGIVLLYLGAEGLIRGAVALGQRARISPIVIGLTIVSMGTSAPELVVSLLAAAGGNSDLAVGNVLGSNLANIGLILGISALLQPLDVHTRVVRREIPWMVGVSVLLVPLLWNLGLGRVEGVILAGMLVAYLAYLYPNMREEMRDPLADRDAQTAPAPAGPSDAPSVIVPVALVLGGILGLVLGGQGIVRGASDLASRFGVPELIVGLSVVAVGTSLPELATTVLAAARKQADLAVGNIVGSNIFNVTFVLGGTALIHPIQVPARILAVELPATLILTLLLLPLAWSRSILSRKEGLLLLAAYLGAWVWILRAG
jgi:cation:H+ antiporter